MTSAGHVEDQVSFIHATSLLTPACLHLEVLPMPRRQAALAWVAEIAFRDRRRFHAVVSADRNRCSVLVLAQTNTCAFSAQWVSTPSAAAAVAAFPAPVITTPSGGAAAGSAWQSVSGFATGPNVSCVPSGSVQIERLGTLPVDNAFVWCNLTHDLLASFGFDQQFFAFDTKDPLHVIRGAAKIKTGGEFVNRADGFSPEMLLHASPHGGEHAATDPTIVVHEYVHGMSSRLVGGGACARPFVTAESLGLSEGYSDFFALTIVDFVRRTQSAGGGPVRRFGERFKPGGLRDYTAFPGRVPPGGNDPYKFGMPWCAGLLDARQKIEADTSPDAADRFLWRACIDSLKSMAPACHSTNSLTLAHAKSALRAAARRIAATRPAFANADTHIEQELGARGI